MVIYFLDFSLVINFIFSYFYIIYSFRVMCLPHNLKKPSDECLINVKNIIINYNSFQLRTIFDGLICGKDVKYYIINSTNCLVPFFSFFLLFSQLSWIKISNYRPGTGFLEQVWLLQFGLLCWQFSVTSMYHLLFLITFENMDVLFYFLYALLYSY